MQKTCLNQSTQSTQQAIVLIIRSIVTSVLFAMSTFLYAKQDQGIILQSLNNTNSTDHVVRMLTKLQQTLDPQATEPLDQWIHRVHFLHSNEEVEEEEESGSIFDDPDITQGPLIIHQEPEQFSCVPDSIRSIGMKLATTEWGCSIILFLRESWTRASSLLPF